MPELNKLILHCDCSFAEATVNLPKQSVDGRKLGKRFYYVAEAGGGGGGGGDRVPSVGHHVD